MTTAGKFGSGRSTTKLRLLSAIISTYLVALAYFGVTSSTIGASSPADEILVLLLLLPAAHAAVKEYRTVRPVVVPLLLYAVMLALSGLWGILRFGYPPLDAGIMGVLLDLKIVVIGLGLYSLACRAEADDLVRSMRIPLAVCFALSLFFIHDLVVNRSISGVRLLNGVFGFPATIGLFSHKYGAANMCVFAICISAALYFRTRALIYGALFVWFSVMLLMCNSVKELLVVPVAILVLALSYSRGSRNIGMMKSILSSRLFLLPIILFTIISGIYILAGDIISIRNQIYIEDISVRGVMYEASVDIAWKRFPFGSGPGTFGSEPSRSVWYSELYYEYGLNRMYGAGGRFTFYIMDTWWPKILAESGFLGLIFYLFSVIYPFQFIIRKHLSRISTISVIGVISGCAVISSSMASPVFNTDMAMVNVSVFWLSFFVLMRDHLAESRKYRVNSRRRLVSAR